MHPVRADAGNEAEHFVARLKIMRHFQRAGDSDFRALQPRPDAEFRHAGTVNMHAFVVAAERHVQIPGQGGCGGGGDLDRR